MFYQLLKDENINGCYNFITDNNIMIYDNIINNSYCEIKYRYDDENK